MGVGDMAEVLKGERVGVALETFNETSMTAALQQLLQLVSDPATSARCVSAAHRHFSLDTGVSLYDRIYKELS